MLDLTEGRPFRALLIFALPVIGGNLFQLFYALGSAAVAGYTAATKADQVSVLVNNAMMTAISNYVAQNYGAGKKDRILAGVRASLLQTEALNLLMCAGIILLRHPIVTLFIANPSDEIFSYANGYLLTVAPFYWLLGLLAVYRMIRNLHFADT